jgi:ABC-type transport system involved in cytochrome bd biosynthesis fused ATPase/permease subunit
MHWSRELLALTAGVRRRIAGLVAIGLLSVAASLGSMVCAGRAIAGILAGQSLMDCWCLIAGAAAAAVVRDVLLCLRETTGERTAAAVKQVLRTCLSRQLREPAAALLGAEPGGHPPGRH